MSRASRGCLPCRTRRVKCDEGRPSCRRCVNRNEVCTGYRDEFSLLFRNENDKAARKSVRRRASTTSLSKSGTPSHTSRDSSSGVSPASRRTIDADDPSDLSTAQIAGLNLASPYRWAKNVPQASGPSAEDQAVSQFFEKYIMYPCNNGSSPGFLECLPFLFEEVKVEGRRALRWAVRAAAYANLSNAQDSSAIAKKALECYGLGLSALVESLADPGAVPDDYTLMTVVVLDLFETLYLHDPVMKGSHAEAMAQILRLRGPNQIYSARGWSLFRLSHHRLVGYYRNTPIAKLIYRSSQQKQQLAFRQSRRGVLPESELWLDSLNGELPYVCIEKDNFHINKTCERARNLRKTLKDTDLPAEQMVDMIKEMHDLDQVATTWRQSPGWTFKTIHRSEITQDDSTVSTFPEYVQLHQDVWIAYEWNYHRTGRIILHEELLECLDRLQSLDAGSQENIPIDLSSLREASVSIIWALIDQILSTVPQSLGDIDHEGNLRATLSNGPKCEGIGGYFLLWSIKIIKSTPSATIEQRSMAERVFERIRECTGMKAALGELSSI